MFYLYWNIESIIFWKVCNSKSFELGAATVNKIVAVYCNNMQFRGVPFQSKWWGGASNAAGSHRAGGNRGNQRETRGARWAIGIPLYMTFFLKWTSVTIVPHYENKFTKTFRPTDILHIFTKFSSWFFFVTNEVNISKFLPPQICKTLISY